MPNFAILDSNNVVINVVVADSIDDLSNYSHIVENNKQDPAQIGCLYDLINDNFTNLKLVVESETEE